MNRLLRRVALIVVVVVAASPTTQAAAGAIWDELSTGGGGGTSTSAARGAPIAVSYFQDAPCPTGAPQPVALRKAPRRVTARPARIRHRRRVHVVRHVPRLHRHHRRRHAGPARIARAPARPPRCEVLRRDSLYRADVSPESSLYSLVSQPVAPETVAQEVAPVAPTASRNYDFQPYNPFPNQYGGGGGGEVPPVAKTTGGSGSTTGGGLGGQSGAGGGVAGGGGSSGHGGETGGGGGTIASSPSAAPEPQSWALLVFGVGMIGGVLRARRGVRAAI